MAIKISSRKSYNIFVQGYENLLQNTCYYFQKGFQCSNNFCSTLKKDDT